MKIIINENERGFLFKNGIYRKLLTPGKHNIKRCLDETYARVNITKPVEVVNADLFALVKDKYFVDNTARIDVPDGFIALHL